MSAWEIRDNRNKLVGKFDTNKITNLQARQEYDKLKALAEIKNIKNDLLSVKDRIKDLFLKNDEWQVCDRAMKALSQTKDTITELNSLNQIDQTTHKKLITYEKRYILQN